ncbi:MAG: putative beta-lysine N-acetyltransferase [Paludibacter sp.]|nr:putative beta-lysine N-acetyltransferase [Paludibacter sp.]MDD4198680.1 putative beta-lysine N-acetyltransferase [Paludibacter sp.]MDD4427098.1 putative beta-lysine N-acetyltransferase [Paludibacter sp.]
MMVFKNKIIKSHVSCDAEGKRAYLMNFDPDDFPVITDYLDDLAAINGYTKSFIKIQAKYAPAFFMSGYKMEAFVPRFYGGNEDAFFLAKYFDQERSQPEKQALSSFLQMIQCPLIRKNVLLDDEYSLKLLTESDTNAMTEVFKQVFDSYPFPIFDINFLFRAMKEGTRYYGIFHGVDLIAISAAECDEKHQSAEMTDFAVLPEYRGKNFAFILLAAMEKDLLESGYITLFTIARLHAISMNKTFFNSGYHYSGTLHNNTNIAGSIESMNVWYKHLKVF